MEPVGPKSSVLCRGTGVQGCIEAQVLLQVLQAVCTAMITVRSGVISLASMAHCGLV